MFLLATATALAQPTYNMPHAAVAEGAGLVAGPGVAMLRAGPLPGGRISGGYYTGRLGLTGSAAGYVGQVPEGFATLGARWMLHEGARLRVAGVGMLGGHRAPAMLDRKATGRLGVALEWGTGRVHGDASLAALGGQWFPAPGVSPSLQRMSTFETLLGSELGVSMAVSEDVWLRAGLLGAFPSLRCTWRQRVSVTVISAGTQNLLQLEVGRVVGGAPSRSDSDRTIQ